ncbi:MAG: cation-transporting P-type ATPase [Planctomycetota bacterium]
MAIDRAYAASASRVADALETDLTRGLSEPRARELRTRHGPNRLRAAGKRSVSRLLLRQFENVLVLVLIAAGVLALVLGNLGDAAAILAIVVLNAAMGFGQEFRAERALAGLRSIAAPTARVVRDGCERSLPADQLVPGDLVRLEAGDHVPADLRVIESHLLRSDESALSGESTPVEKTSDTLADRALPVVEQANVVFLGTSIVHGRGAGVVVATGEATELGHIARLVAGAEESETPLQRDLARLGRLLVMMCLVVVAILLVVGIWRGQPALEMVMTSVALAVAAIPEGLPAIVTITLAISVQRMVRRNSLVRKLVAVETLGAASVILTDKTGTLTCNEMQVRMLIDARGGEIGELHSESAMRLLRAVALCNDASITRDGERRGDPTEVALLLKAAEARLSRPALERESPRVAELPFDARRKRMATLHAARSGSVLYVKGAPEAVLPLCAPPPSAAVTEAVERLASRGMRVLAVAAATLADAAPSAPSLAARERDLELIGLVAMADPPRPEARASVLRARQAGVFTAMITGDHLATGSAIAREVGILDDGLTAIDGATLEQLQDHELTAQLERLGVYARVSPEHKHRIVRLWKATGRVVAVTGDGVNDAPALKEAHVGVAMGRRGTDVARGVADLILTDDNYASIVTAIEEGRRAFQNIRKALLYLLSCNVGEIAAFAVAIVCGWPAPLAPVQILWVNLFTDGLPALALGAEPAEAHAMRDRPRDPNRPLIDRRDALRLVVQAATIGFCTLAPFMYLWFGGEPIDAARTAAFLGCVLSQLVHALNFRDLERSSIKAGLLANRKLLAAIVGSALLQLIVTQLGVLDALFDTRPMAWSLVLATATLALLPLAVAELGKLIELRWRRRSA